MMSAKVTPENGDAPVAGNGAEFTGGEGNGVAFTGVSVSEIATPRREGSNAATPDLAEGSNGAMAVTNPNGGGTKGKRVITDVKALQSTLKELSARYTNQEMAVIREQLDKDARTLLSSQTATRAQAQMTIMLYLKTPPEAAKHSWEMTQWHIAHMMEHQAVRIFIMLFIVLNSIMIGVEADYNSSDATKSFFLAVESIFLVVFIVELCLNLLGFGFMYFDDPWHQCDAGVVLVSLIDFAVTVSSDGSSSGLSVVRLVRGLRVLRVISHSERLTYLVASFYKGMEGLMLVMVLLVLFIYIAAVLGQAFFGESGTISAKLIEHGMADADAYWGTIPRSMVTLIGLSTFDNAINMHRAVGEVYPQSWIFFAGFMAIVSDGGEEKN
jgi:hypothetical protein